MTIINSLAQNQRGIIPKLEFLTRVAFLFVIALIPFNFAVALIEISVPLVWRGYTDVSVYLSDVFMLIMLAAWGIMIGLQKRKIYAGKLYIWMPLAALTVVGWLSIFVSVNPAVSVHHAVRLVVLFLFYLYIVNEVHSFEWLIAGVVLQAVLQSGVAIAQFAAQHSIGFSALGEYDLDPQVPGVSVVSSAGIRYLRAYGLSDHPNILGGCIAFCLLLLVATYLYESEHATLRSWAMLAVLPAGITLFLTFSRSAWVAFFGAILFLIFTAYKKQTALIKFTQIFSVLLLFLFPIIWANRALLDTRLNVADLSSAPKTERQSINERVLLFQSANEIFIQNSLLGIGLGAAPIAISENFPVFPYNYQPPHFALLDAALETGVFGALFYSILLVAPFFVFLAQYKKHRVNPQALMALALLLSLNVVGLFDYYTWMLAPGQLWQWMAWGLWCVAMRENVSI